MESRMKEPSRPQMDGMSHIQIPPNLLTSRSCTSIREGLMRRLADLDLLSVEDVEVVLPGVSVGPPWLSNGESLLVRLPLLS